MNKLTILENGIIPAYEGLNGKENKFVDGRDMILRMCKYVKKSIGK